MATNSFIKPEQIIATAAGLLQSELVLGNTLWHWAEEDFRGAKDDTVNVKVPGRTEARDRKMRADGEGRKIQMSTITETKYGVKLTEFPYNAVPITDEELTFDIEKFGEQILMPQVRAVAEKIEKLSADTITGATFADGIDEKGTNASTIKGTLKAEDFFGAGQHGMYSLFNRVRCIMQQRNIPQDDRIVVVGAGFEEELLNSKQLVEADKAGDNSALREAIIGKLSGFTFISSNYIPEDEAYAFHRSAYVLATAAPQIPAGAKAGSVISHGGLSMRWMRDYDANYATDRSIVDCFAGTGVTPDGGKFLRGLKLTMNYGKVQDAKAGKGKGQAQGQASA